MRQSYDAGENEYEKQRERNTHDDGLLPQPQSAATAYVNRGWSNVYAIEKNGEHESDHEN